MPVAEDNVEACRRQVQRILSSHEFTGSRQLREFLHYVSEAAFEGRTYLDQTEIAVKVLQRGKDFNPLDDASVRKLGTAVRQKLERYYQTNGVGDPVRMLLPVRSYVPLFEVREVGAPVEPVGKQPDQPTSRRNWIIGSGLAAVGIAAGTSWWIWRKRPPEALRTFLIRTQQGDIMHERNEVAPGALQLGPLVGGCDDVTVRLAFTPERATQQAGILVFGDADQYVKLGRQFFSRPQLEFGLEIQGRYLKPPGTFEYDPEAQTGDPVWLSIRRNGSEYRGFVSTDGFRWRQVGNVLIHPNPMASARAAIFAHNGRSDAPSVEAIFDHFSVGVSFHNRAPGVLDMGSFPHWSLASNATQDVAVRLDGESLVVDYSTMQTARGFDFVRKAPQGEWTFSTRLDFLSLNGSTAGLTATGPKGRLRLIRWDLDGGSITGEHLGNRQVNRRDFEGAPPVILRMACRNGLIRCSFSRDDRVYEEVPLTVPVNALTDRDLSVGAHASMSSWKIGDPRPLARFFYVRNEVESLTFGP